MEEKKEKKSLKDLLSIIFLIMGIVLFIFTSSTYLTWEHEKENLNKVYAKYDEDKLTYELKKNIYEVKEIKNFYKEEVKELSLDEDEIVTLYCNKDSECIYVNNKLDVYMFTHPANLIYISIIMFIISILYIIYKKNNNKMINIIVSVIVICSSLGLLSYQIYNLCNYYYFIHNNNSVSNGMVINKIKDSGYLIEYEVDKETYYYETTNKLNVKDEVTVYYGHNKDGKILSEVKHNPFKINELVYIFIILIIGVYYLILSRKEKEEK